MSTRTFVSFITILVFLSLPVNAQSIEDHIARIANGLVPTLKIADSIYKPLSITERMQQLKISGVSIGVIRNYKLEWVKGYGLADSASGTPVTPATIFQAGSISKSLNAMGVLRLADEQKIDLTRNINEYLKSWKFPGDTFASHLNNISTINLLNHTGGLNVHGFPGYTRGDSIPTLQQVLDGQPPANTAAVRSLFPPCQRYQYSGGGVTISQLILTDVTGRPYDQYMKKKKCCGP